jgi:DNA-binding MarR family transcriptional regulator
MVDRKGVRKGGTVAKPPIQLFEECCWDLRGVLTQFGPDEVCCDGLTPRQCRVLRAVGSEADLRLGDLAAREGLTAGGMTRRVEPLVRGGWLRRHKGTGEDGRTVRLELTAKGEKALASVENQIYASVEKLWRAVPAARRPEVLAGLQALVESARKSEAGS